MNSKNKYKVVRYIDHEIAITHYGEYFFRWYWQANMVSFVLHHFLGYSCNTLKRDEE